MGQISCLTFLKYDTLSTKVWGFGMMQFAHSHLTDVKGLQFYKLMGSGKGIGFNPLPDWSVYTILTVWDSIEDAEDFMKNSALMSRYRQKTTHLFTFYLYNVRSHGLWSGMNPFTKSIDLPIDDERLAVITRATIKKRHLIKFWKFVPTSSKRLYDNPNLIFTKGIGEVPIIQMATFSLWKNEEALKAFAYGSKEHNTAVKMTKSIGWYKEELFARFKILKTTGDWPNLHI